MKKTDYPIPDLALQLTRQRQLPPQPPLGPPKEYVTKDEIEFTCLGDERLLRVQPYLDRDPYPIPTTEDREGYCGQYHGAYWVNGLQDYLKVREAFKRHGREWDTVRSVLDLGCSSGRVLRHYACQEPHLTVWGADIDAANVAWVQRHLDQRIIAVHNSMIPHLPIDDASIDVVSAFSVFTHIDLFEVAWLLELRRILRPGGIAYLSIHTERTWRRIADRPQTLKDMQYCQPATPEYKIDRDLFLQPMPSERVVFRRPQANLLCNIFHSEDRLRNIWGRAFQVCEIYDAALGGFQDVMVLQRPE